MTNKRNNAATVSNSKNNTRNEETKMTIQKSVNPTLSIPAVPSVAVPVAAPDSSEVAENVLNTIVGAVCVFYNVNREAIVFDALRETKNLAAFLNLRLQKDCANMAKSIERKKKELTSLKEKNLDNKTELEDKYNSVIESMQSDLDMLNAFKDSLDSFEIVTDPVVAVWSYAFDGAKNLSINNAKEIESWAETMAGYAEKHIENLEELVSSEQYSGKIYKNIKIELETGLAKLLPNSDLHANAKDTVKMIVDIVKYQCNINKDLNIGSKSGVSVKKTTGIMRTLCKVAAEKLQARQDAAKKSTTDEK